MTTAELRTKAAGYLRKAQNATDAGMRVVYLRKARNYFADAGMPASVTWCERRMS